jgi:hypothetical protein
MHIGHIFEEGELTADSVVKDFLITAADGKSYQTRFYRPDGTRREGFHHKPIPIGYKGKEV